MAGGRPTLYKPEYVEDAVLSAGDIASRKVTFLKESLLVDRIVQNIEAVCATAELPEPKKVEREAALCSPGRSRADSKARADLLVTHIDGSISIFEAKRPRDLSGAMKIVAQLMLYSELAGGADNLVAVIDGPLHPAIVAATARFGVPVKWLLADKDCLFLLGAADGRT